MKYEQVTHYYGKVIRAGEFRTSCIKIIRRNFNQIFQEVAG